METDPATRDLVNAMTYSIERTKDPKYLTSEQITSDLHTRASRGPAAQRNTEAQLIAATLLLYSRTLCSNIPSAPTQSPVLKHCSGWDRFPYSANLQGDDTLREKLYA